MRIDGVALLPVRPYNPDVKTLTLKLPDGLLAWLEEEARRANRPKSALVREFLQERQQRKSQSALDLAGDLCGCVESGLGDLSHNRRRLKGFGQ
jgi:hypothetical protein